MIASPYSNIEHNYLRHYGILWNSAQGALQLVWCSRKMPHWRAYSNTANLMQILSTSQQLPCCFLAGDIQLPHTVVEAMQMQVNLCRGHSLCVFSVVEPDPSYLSLFLVLGGSWKKKESCYITVRRWVSGDTVLPCTYWFYICWTETKTMWDFEAITKIINCRSKSSENLFIIYSCAGEREAAINVAEGKKQSQILASEARKMEQINLATGKQQCFYRLICVRKLQQFLLK